MTESTEHAEAAAQHEAVQAVVDRVAAWQHGATDHTVTDELRKGFAETGVEVDGDVLDRLAQAIEADAGPVHATQFLR